MFSSLQRLLLPLSRDGSGGSVAVLLHENSQANRDEEKEEEGRMASIGEGFGPERACEMQHRSSHWRNGGGSRSGMCPKLSGGNKHAQNRVDRGENTWKGAGVSRIRIISRLSERAK